MRRDSRQGREATAWERGMFISLLAQRNEPKKGPPCHWSRRRRDARSLCPAWGTPRCCRGFANSAFAQTVQIPFSAASPVLGCVPMGVFSPPFVLPRLADGGGKRRGNCLRAKPEFFRVPPSARSKGSPQGQDWLGCLFLVSSFGHAKEETMNRRKGLPFSLPGVLG
jgi:hypothetical protein